MARLNSLQRKYCTEPFSAMERAQECLPCTDGVIDFTGEEIIARPPRDNEYFKDPLPVKQPISARGYPCKFLLFLDEVFLIGVRRTALNV
jgi:hypothetical protein